MHEGAIVDAFCYDTSCSPGTTTFSSWSCIASLLSLALPFGFPFGFCAALHVSLEVIFPDELLTWSRAVNVRTKKDLWLVFKVIGVLACLVSFEISTKSKSTVTQRARMSKIVLAMVMLSIKVSFVQIRKSQHSTDLNLRSVRNAASQSEQPYSP